MGILETIAIILVVLWLLGFTMNIAGGLVHILLVVAIVVFAMRFFKKRV